MWDGEGGLLEREPSREIRMGRWSEFRVVSVDHPRSVAISGVAMDRSGDEGVPKEGSRVGESSLRITKLEGASKFRM